MFLKADVRNLDVDILVTQNCYVLAFSRDSDSDLLTLSDWLCAGLGENVVP